MARLSTRLIGQPPVEGTRHSYLDCNLSSHPCSTYFAREWATEPVSDSGRTIGQVSGAYETFIQDFMLLP